MTDQERRDAIEFLILQKQYCPNEKAIDTALDALMQPPALIVKSDLVMRQDTVLDGDTFETDMGYFYEGLENLKDYLNEKNQRETETVKYRKYFEVWLYEILNNNFENKEFCKPIEEIISRLDGFERYVADQEAAE